MRANDLSILVAALCILAAGFARRRAGRADGYGGAGDYNNPYGMSQGRKTRPSILRCATPTEI